jgi:hypothetical protein
MYLKYLREWLSVLEVPLHSFCVLLVSDCLTVHLRVMKANQS